MKKLTTRQREILEFILLFTNKNHRPPTRQEICDYFEFASPWAAECHLNALHKKKAINLVRGKARGIEVIAL